jgi:hypothetical protein
MADTLKEFLEKIEDSYISSFSDIWYFKNIEIKIERDYLIYVTFISDSVDIDNYINTLISIKSIINKSFKPISSKIKGNKNFSKMSDIIFRISIEEFESSNIYKSALTINKYNL